MQSSWQTSTAGSAEAAVPSYRPVGHESARVVYVHRRGGIARRIRDLIMFSRGIGSVLTGGDEKLQSWPARYFEVPDSLQLLLDDHFAPCITDIQEKVTSSVPSI